MKIREENERNNKIKILREKFKDIFPETLIREIFDKKFNARELRKLKISPYTIIKLHELDLIARSKRAVDNSFEGLRKRGYSPDEINRMAEMGMKIDDEKDLRPAWLKDKDEWEY